MFCVDAIQGLGAFPLDVRALGIDALEADGAKWLLALAGVELLYVSSALRERLGVRWRGWRDVADIWILRLRAALAPSAARYEGGTQNSLGIAALDPSLAVLAEANVSRIGEHVLALPDPLVAGLASLGAQIFMPRGDGISSGIVTFSLAGAIRSNSVRTLGGHGFVTTCRPSGIRVSPHGYNTTAKIDAFLSALS